jgi:hypothetical protein
MLLPELIKKIEKLRESLSKKAIVFLEERVRRFQHLL